MNLLMMSRARRRLLRGTIVTVLVLALVLVVRIGIWLLDR
jgi:hypothetical protein